MNLWIPYFFKSTRGRGEQVNFFAPWCTYCKVTPHYFLQERTKVVEVSPWGSNFFACQMLMLTTLKAPYSCFQYMSKPMSNLLLLLMSTTPLPCTRPTKHSCGSFPEKLHSSSCHIWKAYGECRQIWDLCIIGAGTQLCSCSQRSLKYGGQRCTG